MNEVEETLRVIKVEIESHNFKITILDETHDYVSNMKLPEIHKESILESLMFTKSFHEHRIKKLSSARDEIMNKYNIPKGD